MQEKNIEKYQAYKSMNENLSKAMRSEFYYQAIFIEYAIIEDRCTSALKYAGVKHLDSRGNEIKLSKKIEKMRGNPSFTEAFVRKRITLQLLDELMEWKRDRDRLIHALATIPYDYEEVQAIAVKGQELVRVLSNKVASVNNYHKKQQPNMSTCENEKEKEV